MPALEQACPDKLGPMIAEVVTPPLALTLPKAGDNAAPAVATPAKTVVTIDGELFPAMDASTSKRRIVIRSFSSMARHHLAALGEGSSFGDQVPLVDDESATPI